MKILFLSAWYPFPADNGSRIRIFNLLRRLSGIGEITLLVLSQEAPAETPAELAAVCTRIEVVPRKSFNPGSLRSLVGFLSKAPRSVIDTYNPEAADAIAALRAATDFDLAIASQWQTAMYAGALRGLPAIFEEVELGIFAEPVRRPKKFGPALSGRLRRTKLKYYLRSLSETFSAMTVASDEEARLVSGALPDYDGIFVIPNAVNLTDYPTTSPEPVPGRMIFNGALSYGPNAQAMRWFLKHVFLVIRAAHPAAEVLITGGRSAAGLPEMEGVRLTGYLEDIRPAIASSWLALSPILHGGGTRLKILEALALGTPVVTTTKGVEGLALRHEKEVLIADSPADFAAAVLRLLDSADLRQSLALAGRRQVAACYDWDVVFPQFKAVIRHVLAGERQKR